MFSILRRWLGLQRAESSSGNPSVQADDLSDIPRMVQSGQTQEAERRLRRYLALAPDNVDALHYLGLVCHQLGRHGEAVAHITAAVARAPGSAFMHANLAEALRAAGDLGAAESAAREALRLGPDQPEVQFNLAMVLAGRRAHSVALEHALHILGIRPDWPEALTLAASQYIELNERGKAQELLDRARALQPDDAGILVLALRNRAWLCDWESAVNSPGAGRVDEDAFAQMLARRLATPNKTALRNLNPIVTYEYPVAKHLRDAVTQSYADVILEKTRGSTISRNTIKSDILEGRDLSISAAPPGEPSARLRVGYVSADFHRHPTMHLMRSFFALHDRRRFEVFAYSIGEDDGSEYRREAIASVDHFIDIRGDTAHQSAERIASDRIDILVDLKGYTHEARPLIFALRPAPIRVAWLGYPASTGRGINDYIIVDRVVAPPEHQSHFGEQLVWMPHSYQVNDHHQIIASDTPARSDLGLPSTGFIFACFNHAYKIEPQMFAVWMRILCRTPGSVLWLYESNTSARANLERAASDRGVDPARLVFGGTLDKPRHLARLRQADLLLDTLWINAHTGASDALWAGVPVLTCPQDSFPSRVAASLVCAVGLPQLACADLQSYEETAVRLASNPRELTALRRHLDSEPAKLALFDTPRFTRNLERAFETMWQRHRAGEPPRSFAVVEKVDPVN